MTSIICEQPPTVTAARVIESERLSILPALFGAVCTQVESAIFAFMGQLSPDYAGGYWEFVRLSNGGFFAMPPEHTLRYRIESPNGYSGLVSAEAAGIIGCLFAYSHLSFRARFEHVGEHYHLLREYAAEHPEARAIYAAID